MFHRWFRLWPAYAFCILVYWKVLPIIGSGPLWMRTIEDTSKCDENAWRNFLLADNLLIEDFNGHCFGWGWYIGVDF